MQGRVKPGTPLEKTPSGKAILGGLQIIQINTEAYKEMLWWRIQKTNEDPTEANAWFIHCETQDNIINQICSEELRRNRTGGTEWHQIRRDNHILDCEILCLAAVDYELFGGLRVAQYQKAKEKMQQNKPAPSRTEPRQHQENPIMRRY